MKIKSKLILGIILGLMALTTIFFYVKNTLFSNFNSQNEYTENIEMNADNLNGENESVYSIFELYLQDPVTVDASVKLQSDTAYFYQPDMGIIESVLVKDGQKVKQGEVLFNYVQNSKEKKYELEDLYREQTKLYNQRESLINQLSNLTGGIYNYQGDQISYYWGNNGKEVYYIVESIGNKNASNSDQTSGSNTDEQIANGESETIVPNNDTSNSEGLRTQIRQVNEQIEELEIKLIRNKEQNNNKVIAKSDGVALIDMNGKENTSIPLIRIISEGISVVGSVTEYDFYALAEDRVVSIYVPAEDRVVKGKITNYDKVPSYSGSPVQGASGNGFENTGTTSGSRFNFSVQPEEPIQPGFSAKVNITLPGYVIPSDSVIEENNNFYVFLYESGKAVKTKVEFIQQGLQKVVLKGLNEGNQLIMFPYDLTDGQEISILDPANFPEEGFSESEGE